MKSLLLIAFCIAFSIQSFAQKEDYVWVMGYESNQDTSEYAQRFGGTNIDFNTEPPTITKVLREINFGISSSSICDEDGKLVFYFNGCSLADRQDKYITKKIHKHNDAVIQSFCQHGFNFPQANIIFKSLVEPKVYHLLHYSIRDNLTLLYVNDTLYETILKHDDNDEIEIIQDSKVVAVGKFSSMRYAAVKKTNGIDWWVAVPANKTNDYTILEFTSKGYGFVKNETIGTKFIDNRGVGQSKFSPDGKYYAKFTPYEGLDIFDFSRNTGSFSNAQHFDFWKAPESVISSGLEFSPDSRFLYISILDTLWQFEMHAPNIFESKTFIAAYDGFVDGFNAYFFLMQLAPNNKIYMTSPNSSRYMHTIHYPNKKGQACDFRQHDFKLATYNAFTMPYFPNYRLGPAVSVIDENVNAIQMVLYPNPASTFIKIIAHHPIKSAIIFTLDGKMVKSISNTSDIEIADLSNGMYILNICLEDGSKSVLKFIKE